MGKKPKNLVSSLPDRAAGEAAYFFLCGFAFFFTICACVLGGVASIRRASSSSDMGACCGLGAVMGVSCG